MDNYFYGKVTKSSNKLLINIPYDQREAFKHRTKVKVYALDTQEIIKESVIRSINKKPRGMDLNDAKKIIEGFDSHYKFEGKSGNEIMTYAKELIEKN